MTAAISQFRHCWAVIDRSYRKTPLFPYETCVPAIAAIRYTDRVAVHKCPLATEYKLFTCSCLQEPLRRTQMVSLLQVIERDGLCNGSPEKLVTHQKSRP